MRRVWALIRKHQSVLWWLHSGYALFLGTVAMWLGARDFSFLRIIVFHIAFIWFSSLFLPTLAKSPRLSTRWKERLRLAVNYFNKNFYQQVLFFLLPIYYASSTFGSRNMFFVVLLAASAVLSTMDIVFDRYLSVRWSLSALFFGFNLFASINVMLPVLCSISNTRALWISAGLATASFASMVFTMSRLGMRDATKLVLAAALVHFGSVYLLRPLIPPAPLSLADSRFGRSVENLQVMDPLTTLPSATPGKIAVITAIKAPLGLQEDVRHLWYLDERLVYSSPYYPVTGGRSSGYRLWTYMTWQEALSGKVLAVDVETRAGQLIGRARLSRPSGPASQTR